MRITKDEYILKSFSKLRNKKWELYVITRIIHLLNDPEIEFVCQQPIKSKDGERFLTDLCFPALKLYCEIDEQHHANEENSNADVYREKEIIDATGFKERRILVFDDKINDRDLKDIDDEIDKFIVFIRQRKEDFLSEGKFEPWNYERKFDPYYYMDKGYLNVEENVRFKYHKDALRFFGYEGDHHQSATWKIPGTKKKVWFPKLYENKEWINTLSENGETITMIKKDKSKIKKKEEFPIVFAHYKDSLSQVFYKFLGEFRLEVKSEFEHKFHRTSTKIDYKKLYESI